MAAKEWFLGPAMAILQGFALVRLIWFMSHTYRRYRRHLKSPIGSQTKFLWLLFPLAAVESAITFYDAS